MGWLIIVMATAILLINTERRKGTDVLETIRSYEYVEYAFRVYGVYDLIVKVNADTVEELKERIFKEMKVLNDSSIQLFIEISK